MTSAPTTPAATARLTPADVRLEDFAAVLEQTTDLAAYPHAERVEQNVLVYDSDRLRAATTTESGRDDVSAELVRALTDGPGVVVFEAAFPDHAVVDRVTAAFDEIIAEEDAAGGAHGDHFAAPGANSRVWNALEKLAVQAPEAFVDYYANDIIALASTSWLGPAYQVTSQVNVVRPGGEGAGAAPRLPPRLPDRRRRRALPDPRARVVAGADAAGRRGAQRHAARERADPLPAATRSSTCPATSAWRRDDFKAHFAEHHVQLPLRKGDAGFFNPALFHGAGTNVSADIQRMANLLQVSSAFGRAMEKVDRARVVNAVYPALRASGLGADALANAVAASAEGYPFPTNLDLDQPVDGLTPVTQAELVHRALAEGWEPAALTAAIEDYAARRRT